MPFPYDKYPWLNFQELNLAYFIKHFREIFQEWNTLYHDLTEWKDATDQELDEWRTATMAGLDAWKTLTENEFSGEISEWESDVTAALDAWKSAFESEYAALKSEVEDIRDQAALNQQAAEQAALQAAASAAAAANILTQIAQGYAAIMDSNTIHIVEDDPTYGDLDTIPAGNYRTSSATIAASVHSAPLPPGASTNPSFRLWCAQTIAAGSTYMMQLAFLNVALTSSYPRFAFRHRNANGWSNWFYYSDDSQILSVINDMDTRLSAAIAAETAARGAADDTLRLYSAQLRHSEQIALTGSSQIDTLFTAGSYYCPSATVAAALENAGQHPPRNDVGFLLLVINTSADNRWIQLAICNRSSANYGDAFMYRISVNGLNYPSTWRTMAATSDIADIVNSIVDAFRATAITADTTAYITSANVNQWFPTLDWGDLRSNTIVRITESASNLLTNGPEGDGRYYYPVSGESRGPVSGVLMVYQQDPATGQGLTQLFLGYRPAEHTPTLSWRTSRLVSGNIIWSSWSKISQDGVLRASNTVCYGGHLTDVGITDLNDMPNNAIIQIDRNLVGSPDEYKLLNNPAPGVSSIAVCLAFSTSTEHGKAQIVFALNGLMYWRYGYTNAPNDYRWTEWSTLRQYPQVPAAPGRYKLTATVDSGGGTTYAWVADA